MQKERKKTYQNSRRSVSRVPPIPVRPPGFLRAAILLPFPLHKRYQGSRHVVSSPCCRSAYSIWIIISRDNIIIIKTYLKKIYLIHPLWNRQVMNPRSVATLIVLNFWLFNLAATSVILNQCIFAFVRCQWQSEWITMMMKLTQDPQPAIIGVISTYKACKLLWTCQISERGMHPAAPHAL